MADTNRDAEPQASDYEPPEVEDVSTDAGPAVTAAGATDDSGG